MRRRGSRHQRLHEHHQLPALLAICIHNQQILLQTLDLCITITVISIDAHLMITIKSEILWFLTDFERVLQEVTRWAMHKLGVKEWLVLAVMSMYTGAIKELQEQFMVTVNVLR